MDDEFSEYKGVQLLHDGQKEELKSKWRSWFDRKISSETNKEDIPKWKQLLHNNHSPFSTHNKKQNNIKDRNLGVEQDDYENVFSTSIPNESLSSYTLLGENSKHATGKEETAVKGAVILEQKIHMEPGIFDNGRETNSENDIEQHGNIMQRQVDINSIRQITTPSYDQEVLCERYQRDWDNISDFPNVGSALSTQNIETDSSTDVSRTDSKNEINENENVPRYYCPYPPKESRNKMENQNQLHKPTPMLEHKYRKDVQRTEDIKVAPTGNVFVSYFPHTSPQLDRQNTPGIDQNLGADQLSCGSKSTISEHKYDNFPGVNKSKWFELLDSWKLGGRLLRPTFSETNNSSRSTVSVVSDCSTEGKCRENGMPKSLGKGYFKPATKYPTTPWLSRGSSIRQSFSTLSHSSVKRKHQRRNVILMIMIALALLAALAVIIGISIFFTNKTAVLRAHISLIIDNREFQHALTDSSSRQFSDISKPLCNEMYKYFLSSEISSYFISCKVIKMINNDGKVGVFFDIDFLYNSQTDNDVLIEDIIIKKTGRLIKDDKLFLVIKDFLVYVKTIQITLETIYVSGDINLPDRDNYISENVWSSWSHCSTTCGVGIETRYRNCTEVLCNEDNFEQRNCQLIPCPVDGAWSEWSQWEKCSLTCGKGLQKRYRSCNNPRPEFGGKNCSGTATASKICQEILCPIDGGWTVWSTWTDCSVTCRDGIQQKTRSCTKPEAQFGGSGCSGENLNIQVCEKDECPVDGEWTHWSRWTECSLSCGGGVSQRNRSCSNPSPKYGGLYCDGIDNEDNNCNTIPCPIDGGWSVWSQWHDCTRTCGESSQVRKRTCSNPNPKYGGKSCSGFTTDSALCAMSLCPIDGKWEKWSEWSNCDVSCGDGIKFRKRSCVEPKYGGEQCSGNDTDIEECNDIPCPAKPVFSFNTTQAIYIIEGQSQTFNLSATGDDISYTLYKGDRNSTSPSFNVNNGILEISNITKEDIGRFVLKAENSDGSSFHNFTIDIISKPTFYANTSHYIDIDEGRSNTFNLSAEGSNVTYTLYKDGLEITNESNISVKNGILEIPFVSRTDIGEYLLKAENAGGSTYHQFTINVTFKPEFRRNNIQHLELIEGQNYTINLNVTGNPDHITYTTYQDDLQYNSTTVQINGGNLTILAIARKDVGSYVVKAENSKGSSFYNFTIDVTFKPTFKVNTTQQIFINEGRSNTFNLSAEGSNVTYTLYKDGLETTNKSNVSIKKGILEIPSVSRTDMGEYLLKAENVGGSTYHQFTINVTFKPEFRTNNRQHLDLIEGQNYTVNLNVTGNPGHITYAVYKDDLQSNSSTVQINGDTLTILSVARKDFGFYVVKAENSEGSTFHNFTIDVTSKPRFSFNTQHIYIIEGRSQTFNLSATGSNITYTLYKEEMNTSSSRINVNNGILEISNITIDDNGSFVLKAENSLGSTFFNFTIDIIVKPAFYANTTQQIFINEGRSNTFNLSAEGSNVTYTLYKDGLETTDKSNISVINGILEIPSVSRTDIGKYVMKAENAGGSTYHQFTINVTFKPEFRTNSIHHLDLIEGQNYTVNLNVTGSPDHITYTIYKDGLQSNSSTVHINGGNLIILSAAKKDVGSYVVKAENSEGSTFHDFSIDVTTKPVFHLNTTQDIYIIEGQTNTFNLSASGTNITYTLYKGGLNETVSRFNINNGILEISNITKEDIGSFVLKAENSLGSTFHNFTIDIIVRPIFNANTSQQIDINEGQSNTFNLSADGSNITYTLYKDGLVITNKSNISVRNGILQIPSVARTDMGEYLLKAENAGGSTYHQFTINVTFKPEFRRNNVQRLDLIEGQNYAVNMNVSGNPDHITYTIYKDGLQSNSSTVQINNGTLTILSITRTDLGSYVAKAENTKGSTFYNFTINVTLNGDWSQWSAWTDCSASCDSGNTSRNRTCNNPYPEYPGRHCVGNGTDFASCNNIPCLVKPEFSFNTTQNIQIGEGRSHTFNISATGDDITYTLYKGDIISTSNRININNGMLKISNITKEDIGLFVLKAENSEGSSFHNFTIDIIFKPTFYANTTQHIYINEGRSNAFNLSATGRNVTYTLYKDGFKTTNESNISVRNGMLEIPSVSRTDMGEYLLKAENAGGSTYHQFTINVAFKPEFRTNNMQHLELIEGQNYTINLNVTGNPDHITYSIYKDGLQSNSSTIQINDGTLTILSITRTDLGSYVAKAENTKGSAFYNFTINVTLNGNWSKWSEWTVCSLSCESGNKYRNRTCINPYPEYPGRHCDGNETDAASCNNIPCPVNGNLSNWTTWSVCSVTCGEGTQTRNRSCTDPQPQHGGSNCIGNATDVIICNNNPCPINGNWSLWSEWGECSSTCGTGITIRNRTCTDPVPQNGGEYCDGNDADVAVCRSQPCPTNGKWSVWGEWSSCSVTCGGGTKLRNRTCSNPPPAFGGIYCEGKDTDEANCYKLPCPVDGNWSEWSQWEECNVTCGGGIKSRSRTCTNPEPQFNGQNCTGNETDHFSCNAYPCPIDGNWSEWSKWEECSVTCEGGIKSRNRTCTNPKPQFDGQNCTGNETDHSSCNEYPCPIAGNWSEWSIWEECSVTCGGGNKNRNRTCTNPQPQFGGNNCTGNETDHSSCNEYPCPIDGNWSEWSNWEECSVTCGGGIKSRSRTCTNPEPQFDGQNCTGNETDHSSCNEYPCPIDGNWSEWSKWEECSVTCGGGNKNRNRTCTNPQPQFGGHNCTGNETDHSSCNEYPCPIDGNWSEWSNWEECSVTCGGGIKSRSRTCTNPEPQFDGQNCTGNETDHSSCNEYPCPIDGNWSEWSKWEECSVTCGGGNKNRNRTCTNPQPQFGGHNCTGNETDHSSCNEYPCPIDGNWSEWSNWEECSVTCGGGIKSRSRTCTNPEPQFDGQNCTGNETDHSSCNEYPCPIDGNWSEWSKWQECSVTCGGGNKNRNRTCTNPQPQFGGNNCTGNETDHSSCNEYPCPIDGNWSEWSNWNECSVTCGGGIKSRSRTCTNPEPQFDGQNCTGNETDHSSCNEYPCPIDGNWSEWSKWEECSVTCGGGNTNRNRTCTNPQPQFGGNNCTGNETDHSSCNEYPCPIDGNWSEWSKWEECSVACGGGIKSRSRTCINPEPQFDGQNCTGNETDHSSCNEYPCPIDGNWSEWSKWEECSVTCGGGNKNRNRTCTNPQPQFGGHNCTGNETDHSSCNEYPCPIDGNWSEWSKWEECSVTCGGGIKSRSRTCTNPEPQFDGQNCTGNETDHSSCNEYPCPIDGNWSEWSKWEECSVTCGGGNKNRNRTCTNPQPQFGGHNCTGNETDHSSCNEYPCPIDGNWSEWSKWEECSVTCGGGIKSRNRTCTNPEPQFDGQNCTGNETDHSSCNEYPCPIDGNWSEWSKWEECSVTCGGGNKSRNRTCTNPQPQFGGHNCTGNETDHSSCNEYPCPIDGNWSEWSKWEECSVTCGGGIKSRSRTCTNPEPQFDGQNCTGNETDHSSCNEYPCPIDGNWSEWSKWEECSVTCGGGNKNRNRTCTNPQPQFGGHNCTGNETDHSSCNEYPCPIDGNWSEWRKWKECSVTCGRGIKSRNRTCSNPEPQFDGQNCTGIKTDYSSCNEYPCPIDGDWSEWSKWEECSVTCGGGIKSRNRTCSNPEPQFDGQNCTGNKTDHSSCNEYPCPIDGNWSEWNKWEECDVTCGGGIKNRNRTCTNPAPQFDGQNCTGNETDYSSCNEYPCPIDGNWSEWSKWEECSVTCGGGIKNRNRTCTNPEPQFDGQNCTENETDYSSCNKYPCPVNGGWSEWSKWQTCSISCGGGIKIRGRTCTNPEPQFRGHDCTGNKTDYSSCNGYSCPIDGNWSEWDKWEECSVTCGGGIKSRNRKCTDPEPQFGGRNCTGNDIDSTACNENPCPIHGQWSDWLSWSTCTVSCGGGGIQHRKRDCTDPPPSMGGGPCIGNNADIQSCGEVGCPGLLFKSVDEFQGTKNVNIKCQIENFTSWNELEIAKNSREWVTLKSDGTKTSSLGDMVTVTSNVKDMFAELNLSFNTLKCEDEGTYICSVDQNNNKEAEIIVKTAPTGQPLFDIDTEIFGERRIHFSCTGDPGYPGGHLEFWVKFRNETKYEEYRFHSALRTVKDKHCERQETVQVDFLFPMKWNGAKIRCQAPESDLYKEREIWLISEFYCDTVPLYTSVRHPYTCKKYMRCLEDKVDVMECPAGLCYNEDLQQCVYQ